MSEIRRKLVIVGDGACGSCFHSLLAIIWTLTGIFCVKLLLLFLRHFWQHDAVYAICIPSGTLPDLVRTSMTSVY
jgi:hypothetical protein